MTHSPTELDSWKTMLEIAQAAHLASLQCGSDDLRNSDFLMCQLCLPMDPFSGSTYIRENRPFQLGAQAPSYFGLPYGIYPRGIMSWIVSEIRIKKSRELKFGKSFQEFIAFISGGKPFGSVSEGTSRSIIGGVDGNIVSLEDQLASLMATRMFFQVDIEPELGTCFKSVVLATSGNFPNNPKIFGHSGLSNASIVVGEAFYEDCLTHAYSLDLRILRACWSSCMDYDIYTWLAYKAFTTLHTGCWDVLIPWQSLELLFGLPSEAIGSFPLNFFRAAARVRQSYDGAEISEVPERGIRILLQRPSVVSMSVSGGSQLSPATTLQPKKEDPSARS